MRSVLALVFMMFISSLLHAQEIRIYNISSLKPINNVYILEQNTERSASSNEKGGVDLSTFKDDDTVLIQHPSYLPELRKVSEIRSSNNTIYMREKTVDLLEFVVTSNKREQKKTEVSNQVSRMTARDIELLAPQTSADLLEYSGDVFIQKSQLGGGSPMIRGFSANKVLIVVDGVRMNNAIFRGGNLQNVINIDPLSVQSTEVIYGPSSLIYGSDALGGVMSFNTMDAQFSKNDSLYFDANVYARYSSANNERTIHGDFNFGSDKLAFFTSVSASEFSDLKAGRNRPEKYGDFGLRDEYVVRDSGKDTVIKNPDPHIMRNSGYSQINLMQKIAYRPKKGIDLDYAVMYSTTTDIPRYDRLIQKRDGQFRNAEWYYGPQEWMMQRFQAKLDRSTLIYDKLRITGAWQHFTESRNDRRFGDDWLRQREENVDVFTLNFDMDKELTTNDKLFYGLEGSFNAVASEASRTNIVSGEVEPTSSRYPSAGSEVYQASAYLLYQKIWTDKLSSNFGLRYTQYSLNSDLSERSFFDFPYDELQVNTGALTGNAGIVYTPSKKWQFSTNLSSGFRAPNVDDVAKVFDSEPGRVLVPNPDLKPEYAYTGEVAGIRTFGRNSKLQVNAFYTYAFNAIVRGDLQFNGQDSIIYDGVRSEVQSLVNTSSASIYGVSYSAEIYLTKSLGIKSSLSLVQGQEEETGESLRHVPPLFGSSNIFFRQKNFYIQLGSQYNGMIASADLAPSERSKTHIYADDGSLSWWTLNAKLSYEFKTFALQAGCDNILDRFYWPYSSGIAAPGRNIYTALKFKF